MLRRTFLAGLGLASMPLAMTTTASAQRWVRKAGFWELLGQQRVGFSRDRDVIHVGRREGTFRAIKLRAIGNDIEMLDLKVIYGNGEVDDIPVRRLMKAGTETPPLDLRGRDRLIQSVQMVYRARPNYRGQATMQIYGLH